MQKFIPKVIVFGNESELPRDFPTEFQIVGHLENRDSKLFLDGEQIDPHKLRALDFDYLLATDRMSSPWMKHFFHDNNLLPFGVFATQNFFRYHVTDVGFVSPDNLDSLTNLMREMDDIHRVLDLDSYLLRGGLFDVKIAPPPKIETIIQNPQKIASIFRSVYDQIFRSFEEIKLRSYDLIILTAERSIEEWRTILSWACKSAREIVAFIHQNSPALPILKQNLRSNFKIDWIPAHRGEWVRIQNSRAPSIRAWVVTHRKYSMPSLPDGYEWIHAGKGLSKIDLGIRGDDSGDNISDLNPKLNEYTVHYWVWKNARSDFVGFSHYRRYFVLPGEGEFMLGRDHEHILTMREAMDLLKDYDIIIDRDETFFASPKVASESDYQLVRKYLARVHPEDLELFDRQLSWTTFNCRSMFFTRWKVFDAYCEWLFSFLIPAAREFAPEHAWEIRKLAYYGEFMLTTFLAKHNLRVKHARILSCWSDVFNSEECGYADRVVF